MKKRWIFSIVFVFLAFLAGCNEPDSPSPATEPQCLQVRDKMLLMETAESVIREMQFPIQKMDYESGYLKTRWLRGAQFFEFWRGDNVGEFNTAESSIHSLERSVELLFDPSTNKTCIECIVNVRRLSLPERPIYGMARMSGLHTGGNYKKQLLELNRSDYAWIDLGRDGDLEAEILKRINNILSGE